MKSDFYDRADGHTAMGSERDPAIHHQIRKNLSHAFSAKALRDQEDVVHKYIDLFMVQVKRLGDDPEGIKINEVFRIIIPPLCVSNNE